MAIDSGGSPQPQDYFYYYLSQKLLWSYEFAGWLAGSLSGWLVRSFVRDCCCYFSKIQVRLQWDLAQHLCQISLLTIEKSRSMFHARRSRYSSRYDDDKTYKQVHTQTSPKYVKLFRLGLHSWCVDFESNQSGCVFFSVFNRCALWWLFKTCLKRYLRWPPGWGSRSVGGFHSFNSSHSHGPKIYLT